MKTTYRFMGLLGSLVYVSVGGNAYASTQFTPNDLPDNPSVITNPAPPAGAPEFGMQYAMKFVIPPPGIDFKILKVTPDPSIDYKIRIVGPRSHRSLMGRGSRPGDGFRNNLHGK